MSEVEDVIRSKENREGDYGYRIDYKVQKLDFSDMDLCYCPDGLSRFKYLEVLDLSGNAFSNLSNEIFELESLEELYLGGCDISKFSSKIKNLRNLRILGLEHNDFTELSDLPPNLVYLNLESNHLTNLPKLPRTLRRLDIAYNNFTEFPKHIFEDAPTLTDIEFKYNKFKNDFKIVKTETVVFDKDGEFEIKVSNLKYLEN